MAEHMYVNRAFVNRIIDGDTVDLKIDLGFGITLPNERVRLYGLDTGEVRGAALTEAEKQYGNMGADYVRKLIPVGSEVQLRSMEFRGKFGRILGVIYQYPSGTCVNSCLKQARLAVDYFDDKERRAEAHRENMIFHGLIEDE